MVRWMRRVLGLALAAALLCCALLPTAALAASRPPEVTAGAYIVMDAATGQVLVAGNAHEAKYPASITKILTLALVLENVDLESAGNDAIETSQEAVDALIYRATMIALSVGEVATLNDLLYATKLESANDAANVLAEYISGSMDGFAQLMNEKVAQLGLTGSHFMNPSGQPDDAHYVTAYDMAVITRWALSVPGFRELFGATEYSMGATNKNPGGRQFHNANMIMEPHSAFYYEGVTGSKTGYTDAARYTLATTARRDGTELICIALDCPFNNEKYTSTSALLDYCFDNFERVRYPLGAAGTARVPVYGGGDQPLGEIEVYGDGEVEFMLHKELSADALQLTLDVPERYIIGQGFAPTLTVQLPETNFQQQAGVLASAPMYWSGLEDVVAANTKPTVWARMADEQPVLFWLIIAVPALVVLVVLGRILHVRHKKQKRRMLRLAAAKAQLPVRIADRPEPPERRVPAEYRSGSAGRYLGSSPRPAQQAVGQNTPVNSPRRVGRAR